MKMRVNKHVTRVVAGTISASILANSCTPYFEDDDSIYAINTSNQDLGKIAVPISINLKPEEAKYAAFLQKLSKDIIEHPVIAKEFSKNPELFLQRYGYNESVSLDEGLLNLVLALGDDDINRAIKLNDIKLFYNLCNEKGLLNFQSSFGESLSNEELQKKLNDMGIDVANSEDIQAIFFTIPVIYIAAVAVVAVVYAAVYDEVAVGSEYWGSVKKTNLELLTESNPILNIWTLKDKKDKTYFVVSAIVENQINDAIEIVKQKNPSYFERNSEEDLRNLLRLNLLK